MAAFLTSRYLHDIFPMGGPQEQGNRLAGVGKIKASIDQDQYEVHP